MDVTKCAAKYVALVQKTHLLTLAFRLRQAIVGLVAAAYLSLRTS